MYVFVGAREQPRFEIAGHVDQNSLLHLDCVDLFAHVLLIDLEREAPFDPHVSMTGSSLEIAWVVSQVEIATVTRRLTAAYITVVPEEVELVEVEVLHHQRLSMHFRYKIRVCVVFHEPCSKIVIGCRLHRPDSEINEVIVVSWERSK